MSHVVRDWPQIHYVSKDDLELLILLSVPPKRSDGITDMDHSFPYVWCWGSNLELRVCMHACMYVCMYVCMSSLPIMPHFSLYYLHIFDIQKIIICSCVCSVCVCVCVRAHMGARVCAVWVCVHLNAGVCRVQKRVWGIL